LLLHGFLPPQLDIKNVPPGRHHIFLVNWE